MEPRPIRPGIWLALLLVALLAARLVFLAHAWSVRPEGVIAPDSWSYEDSARALLAHGRFAVSPERPEVPQLVRTPGYPLLIAGVYGVFGESRPALLAVQIVVSVLTVLLLYLLVRELAAPAVALAAAGILALDPMSFIYSQVMLTETLFTFLMVAAGWAGVRLLRGARGAAGWAAGLGLALALATHVRPLTYYLPLPVLVLVALAGWRSHWPARRVLLSVFMIALPVLVLVGGWQWRNGRVSGSPEFSQIKNVNLLLYRAAGVVALRDGISFEEAQRRLEAQAQRPGATEVETWRGYAQTALPILKAHPVLVVRTQISGMLRMLLGPGGNSLRQHLEGAGEGGPVVDLQRLSAGEYIRKWVLGRPMMLAISAWSALYLLLLYALIILGLIARRGRWRSVTSVHLLILCILLYLIVLSAGPEAYSRFRVPLVPFLGIYAAAGLMARWRPESLAPAGGG